MSYFHTNSSFGLFDVSHEPFFYTDVNVPHLSYNDTTETEIITKDSL